MTALWDPKRGAPYGHVDGESCKDPAACARCYKYACAGCGERSNHFMSCLFCFRHLDDAARLTAVAKAAAAAQAEAPPPPRKGHLRTSSRLALVAMST
jgi:hypothetical protein